MKIRSAEFAISAPDLRSCPPWALPEFALIGRSNVGKSSLINLLASRRDLARVSNTPGKTQLINFFRINGSWCLVDLPGYGYAKIGEQRRLEFNQAVAEYLSKRPNLRRVFVLIDSRLPPQPIDIEFLDWIAECPVPHALIFTKTDKQSASKNAAAIEQFKKARGAACPATADIFVSSSETGDGRSAILQRIADGLDVRNGAAD
jgi:GTP-binding protein